MSSKLNNPSHTDNLVSESQAQQLIGANCRNMQYSLPFHTQGGTYKLTIGIIDQNATVSVTHTGRKIEFPELQQSRKSAVDVAISFPAVFLILNFIQIFCTK